MLNHKNSKENLRQNLIDAGIDKRVINIIMSDDLLDSEKKIQTMEVLTIMYPNLSDCDAIMYALYIGEILK